MAFLLITVIKRIQMRKSVHIIFNIVAYSFLFLLSPVMKD